MNVDKRKISLSSEEDEVLIDFVKNKIDKRKSTFNPKSSFSPEEDEVLIDYVKNNEILYNAKIKEFKNSFAKSELWEAIGQELKKTGEYT